MSEQIGSLAHARLMSSAIRLSRRESANGAAAKGMHLPFIWEVGIELKKNNSIERQLWVVHTLVR